MEYNVRRVLDPDKRHKPKWFCSCSFDNFPDVDAHFIKVIFNSFTSAILTDLKCFPLILLLRQHAGRHWYCFYDHLLIKFFCNSQAILRGCTNHFRNCFCTIILIIGIFSFWRKPDKKIAIDFESAFFQYGNDQFICGTWIGRGFQNNKLSFRI